MSPGPDTGDRVMNGQVINRDKLAEVAGEVRAFYNAHPYPPPVTDLDGYRQSWQDQERRRTDHHLLWPFTPFQECRSILVAGCGTSQAARYALRHPSTRVVGIDVSSTSLEQTEALKRQYDLTHLELHELPVERVRELGLNFDKIICTGVLHHLPDPDMGLGALRNVLAPSGAMHLMMYATYGRTGVSMLQEYCRRLDVGLSDSEVLDLANTLKALPPQHPMAHLLYETSDFRSKAGVTDALLHPKDRAYTVPQLYELLDQAGLVFERWVRQAPYLPQCGEVGQSPHGPRLARLEPAEQYAAIELFRGTMARHSAIVYRSDRPEKNQAIRFDDAHWLKYVPIRIPQTVCVEERVPEGAVAVLVNPGHTYSDLYLPVSQEEKCLFDAIDGKRTIEKIVQTVYASNNREQRDHARSFFEKLWWYDQVVFDASQKKV